MGRLLHLDPFAGAAGDMYIAMLLDLGGDFAHLQRELRKLPLHGEYQLTAEKTLRLGLSGTYFEVHLTAAAPAHEHTHGHAHEHDHEHTHVGAHTHHHPPTLKVSRKQARKHSHTHTHTHEHGHDHAHGHSHDHEHEHDHDHAHTHGAHSHDHAHDHSRDHAPGRPHSHDPARAWKNIRALIGNSKLTTGVKTHALQAFEALAISEAKQHGVTPDAVTFHEVGAVDSIIDIVGAAILLEQLEVDEITCGPIATGGGGYVDCDHGRFPVPAPATLELLRDLPLRATDIPVEMCTPTGAALLKAWSTSFGTQPAMVAEAVGYGAGKREHSRGIPNLLRGMLGTRSAAAPPPDTHKFAGRRDQVVELEANIDDMSSEGLALALDTLMAAGALDVQLLPATMKKSRPGHLLRVLCDPSRETALAEAMLIHTTTFGVRVSAKPRYTLQREIRSVATPFGRVRIKIGLLGDQPLHFVPEYEDLRAVVQAHEISFETAHAAALAAFDADLPGSPPSPPKRKTARQTRKSSSVHTKKPARKPKTRR